MLHCTVGRLLKSFKPPPHHFEGPLPLANTLSKDVDASGDPHLAASLRGFELSSPGPMPLSRHISLKFSLDCQYRYHVGRPKIPLDSLMGLDSFTVFIHFAKFIRGSDRVLFCSFTIPFDRFPIVLLNPLPSSYLRPRVD